MRSETTDFIYVVVQYFDAASKQSYITALHTSTSSRTVIWATTFWIQASTIAVTVKYTVI